MSEDNPFAGSDGDDDYNPFEEDAFDKKKKAAAIKKAPVKGPATLTVESKNEAPDWAKAVDDSDKQKSEVAQETEKVSTPVKTKSQSVESVPLLSASSSQIPVPDWATHEEKPKPTRKAKSTQPESQQLQAISGQNYGGTTNMDEGLLSGQVELDGMAVDPNRTPNWPPFSPRCCWPFRPCFHHNFRAELPTWGYSTVKLLFAIWYVNSLALFWNFIATLAALDCKSCDQNSLFQTVGLALLFLVCCIPCSYYCWFHQLHNAVRRDSSLKFGLFFFSFVIQILVSIVFAIGFPGSGGAGLWGAIMQLGVGSSEIAFIMFASSILWILLAIIQIISVQRVLMVFRTSGQSLERAQGEAAKTGGQVAYRAANTDAGKTVMKGAASAAWQNA